MRARLLAQRLPHLQAPRPVVAPSNGTSTLADPTEPCQNSGCCVPKFVRVGMRPPSAPCTPRAPRHRLWVVGACVLSVVVVGPVVLGTVPVGAVVVGTATAPSSSVRAPTATWWTSPEPGLLAGPTCPSADDYAEGMCFPPAAAGSRARSVLALPVPATPGAADAVPRGRRAALAGGLRAAAGRARPLLGHLREGQAGRATRGGADERIDEVGRVSMPLQRPRALQSV
jgi:hypothetical protein